MVENIQVKNLIISKQKEEYENFIDLLEIAQKKKINIIVVKAKDKIIFDDTAYMNVLYPTERLEHEDINNNSIVAKFVCQNVSILLTRRY